jgi:hypothetical protein
MSREVDPVCLQAEPAPNDQVWNAQRDRDAAPRCEHPIDAARLQGLHVVGRAEAFAADEPHQSRWRRAVGDRRHESVTQFIELVAHRRLVDGRFERARNQQRSA